MLTAIPGSLGQELLFILYHDGGMNGKAWLLGDSSTTLIMPKELAIKYGMDGRSNIVFQETKVGPLLRKLDL